MTDYGDQIILKKVKSGNDKAPIYRAEITINGQKYKAGLWLWTKRDGSEVLDRAGERQLKGKVEEDNYQPGGGQGGGEYDGPPASHRSAAPTRYTPPAPPATTPPQDDSIPF